MLLNALVATLNQASVGVLLMSLGVSLLITLFASLVVRELSTGNGFTSKLINANFDVVLIPAFFIFCFIFIVKLVTAVT